MTRQRSADNLSVEELRHLLLEKRRNERQARLRKFAQTRSALPHAGQRHLEPLAGSLNTETPSHPGRTRRRSSGLLSALLLVIEVTSAVGLILVLLGTLNLLRQINQTSNVAALSLPTLTSTHTPPASATAAEPTYVLPAVLPPLRETPQPTLPVPEQETSLTSAPAESLTPLPPTPAPAPEHAARIRIPAIGVDADVLPGDDWETLKSGVGQSLINRVDPGQPGNVVLSAHNDIYDEIFRQLDQLKPGDEIILLTENNEFTYTVQDTQIVAPDQVQWIGPTADAVVTLVSCYPYQIDTERIIIRGVLKPISN